MPDQVGDDERLERLRDLSNQITEALGQMLVFEARVNAALREIVEARAVSIPYPSVKSRGAVRCAVCNRAIHKATDLVVRRSAPMHLKCYERAAGTAKRKGTRRAA